MPTKDGRKSGGRQKGTPNRLTLDAIECLKNADFSPLEELVATYRKSTDENVRVTIARDLAQYIYPKRKAIEHSGDASSPLVIVMDKDDLKA